MLKVKVVAGDADSRSCTVHIGDEQAGQVKTYVRERMTIFGYQARLLFLTSNRIIAYFMRCNHRKRLKSLWSAHAQPPTASSESRQQPSFVADYASCWCFKRPIRRC